MPFVIKLLIKIYYCYINTCANTGLYAPPPVIVISPLQRIEVLLIVFMFVPDTSVSCFIEISWIAVSALPKLACTQESVFAFVTAPFAIVRVVEPVTSPVCVALLTLAVLAVTALVKSVFGTLLNQTSAFVVLLFL